MFPTPYCNALIIVTKSSFKMDRSGSSHKALQKSFGKFTSKTPVAESFFNKVLCQQHIGAFLKDLQLNFAKFLLTALWQNISG